MPLAEQVQLANERVCEFMAEMGGDVKVWVTAQRFLFFYAEKNAIEIAPSGKVLSKWQGRVPSRGSLRVGNQAITPLDTDDR